MHYSCPMNSARGAGQPKKLKRRNAKHGRGRGIQTFTYCCYSSIESHQLNISVQFGPFIPLQSIRSISVHLVYLVHFSLSLSLSLSTLCWWSFIFLISLLLIDTLWFCVFWVPHHKSSLSPFYNFILIFIWINLILEVKILAYIKTKFICLYIWMGLSIIWVISIVIMW